MRCQEIEKTIRTHLLKIFSQYQVFDSIKIEYIYIIIILLLMSIISCFIPNFAALQVPGIVIALVAALLAFAVSDPIIKNVLINLKTEIAKNVENDVYKKSEIGEIVNGVRICRIKEYYDKFPNTFESYQFNFKMKNLSGFDLKNPTFSFWLPENRQHPRKDKSCNIRFFNTNLHNDQKAIFTFFSEDKILIANKLFPYWHDQREITIWIRMVDDGNLKPFDVDISVNCDNAEGWTKSITINPKELLDQTKS